MASYEPYVTQPGNNQQRRNKNSLKTNAAPSSDVYAPISSGTKATSSPYGISSTTNATESSQYLSSSLPSYSGAYSAHQTTPSASAPSANAYAPMTSGTTITSGNPYGSAPTSAGANSGLPDFSKALDVPPPSVTTGSSGYPGAHSVRQPGNAEVVATAYPVGGMVTSAPFNQPSAHGISLITSKTYQGGPTNGLVSEGTPVNCHKIDYEIKGHEMQLVEIELDPSEVVIGEAGGMMFMEDGIKFEAKFGDGSDPKQGFWKKLMAAGGRLMTGESLFVTHFTNESQRKARVAFAAPYPGTVVPLNLADLGGAVVCQRDAFLCAALGTKISMTFNKRIGSGLFGGEGFILQKVEGDGMAFVHAGGTIIKRQLNNERIRLDTGCLVAFTPGIQFDIMFSPGLKTAFFGGEGLFLAVLKGTGTVWMQSLPFSRMADRIIQSAPSAGGRRVGEGSALTGRVGDVVNGDGFGFNPF
mmetsp:Transcript_18189/g.33770  ORF Transcript_18189/g.33770 Transcript_18189/m.33770 type:complete len:471 (-) Transcript_18189:432-1844(-)